LSIPSTALLWNMAPIFGWFGQPQEVVELAQPYLHIVCWGLWANFVAMACLEVIIGVGRAKLILIFSFVTVALNLVWSYILIFGKFGFPALGIAGAGWGVTISNVGTLLVVIAYITVDKSQRNYFREVFALHKPVYLWELIQIGLPIGLMYCVEVAFFFALTLAMGVISIEVQAANQVALQYLSLVISIIFAMAQAITVRMGHLIGAKQYHQAERASYIGIGLGLIFISFVAIIYWVFPLLLISVDFDIHLAENASIIATIKRFLAICAVFQIAETLRISLFGALRSVKDTKFTLFTSFISFWLIAFPLGYLFAVRWQWGGIGYWWGMLIGASSSVIILQWRYRKKMGYLLNKN
jgi:MATE family multidrug resistance protein